MEDTNRVNIIPYTWEKVLNIDSRVEVRKIHHLRNGTYQNFYLAINKSQNIGGRVSVRNENVYISAQIYSIELKENKRRLLDGVYVY